MSRWLRRTWRRQLTRRWRRFLRRQLRSAGFRPTAIRRRRRRRRRELARSDINLSGNATRPEAPSKKSGSDPRASHGSCSAHPEESKATPQGVDGSASHPTETCEQDGSEVPDSQISMIPLGEGERVRIAFVVNSAITWTTLESVIQACWADSQVSVHIVLASSRESSLGFGFTDVIREDLLAKGISFYPAESYDVESFRPHVVFPQSPFDEHRPPHLRAAALRAAGVRVAYVPYGLEIGGGLKNLQYQYNMEFHNWAWRIFARSEGQRRMFGRYCAAGCGHVVVTGHPKLDAMSQASASSTGAELKAQAAGRPIVLWCPHFSVAEPPEWSTFELFGEHILVEMAARPEVLFVVRPHPLLFPHLRKMEAVGTQCSLGGEDTIRKRLTDLENVTLDEHADYLASLMAADALMADVGSFLLEFAVTGKPLLYLHHPRGLGVNDEGRVVLSYQVATGEAGISEFLDRVSRREDPDREIRIAAVRQALYELDGKAGTRIKDHVLDALRRGDDGLPRPPHLSNGHGRSLKFWTASDNTYLAPSDYYDRQENEIRNMLPLLGEPGEALDIGCGDGRFTLLFAEIAGSVAAIDVSEALIEKARNRAQDQGIANICFEIDRLEDTLALRRYDLVSCMGVTSCMIDELSFLFMLDRLRAALRPGGKLLMKESLSLGADRLHDSGDGYLARYRGISDYRQAFLRRGFELEEEVVLSHDEDQALCNHLFLFKRPEGIV